MRKKSEKGDPHRGCDYRSADKGTNRMTYKRKNMWTDEESLTALAMRDEGYTHRQIGEHLGRTRTAVIGHLDRIDKDYEASK